MTGYPKRLMKQIGTQNLNLEMEGLIFCNYKFETSGCQEIDEKDSNTESINHNLEINENTVNHVPLDKYFRWPPANTEKGFRKNPEESTYI